MRFFDHFDLLAPLYDKVFSSDIQQEWIHHVDVQPGIRLVDAGGGTGRVSRNLKCLDCDVIIADASMGMLRQVLPKENLIPVASLVEQMPFPSDSIDRIIMVDALHHVINQEHSIAELWRILKPDGRIVIEEPDIDKTLIKLLALIEKLLLMRSHFLSGNEIRKMFQEWTNNIEVIHTDSYVWVVVKK